MPEGPEPSGWELLRMLEVGRENVRRDMADVESALDTRMASREWVQSEIQRVLDHIENNTQRIENITEAIDARVATVEKQKQDSRQFRRTVVVALITVSLGAVASIILALIHLGGH